MVADAGTGSSGHTTALPPDAQAWVDHLGLEPLDHEGGLFAQNHLDEHSSAIYYLLARPDFSALHALASVEVYHWYAGSPLSLLILHPDGRSEERVLGPDFTAGQEPQLAVPAGAMQGSSPAGEWCLVGTTMAPPFDWEGFELGDRVTLQVAYPEYAERISSLTRN
ncbi:cupin domain-containing protein [Leucobacter sp. W1478]|uniref:cupin domain-containing protein n=1 Tax=Leucobacter sp. W1478 TaxID=3439065 RepID=UPI003F3C7365